MYPQRAITATQTWSSHSGTVLYNPYVAGHRNLDIPAPFMCNLPVIYVLFYS